MVIASIIALWIAMAINVFTCWLSVRRVQHWRQQFRALAVKHAALIEAISLGDGGEVTITVHADDTVIVTRRVAEKSEMTVQ